MRQHRDRGYRAKRAFAQLVSFSAFALSTALAQVGGGNSPVDPDLFGPALKPLIAAQQQAVSAGDADAVLVYSRALAMAALDKLAKLDPKDEACSKAIASLPSSDRLVSDRPTALLLLQAELDSRERAQAAALADQIASTHTDSVALRIQLSKMMADNSDLDGAVKEATRAVQLDPNSVDAQIALGMAWWALNEFGYNEESLRAFTAAQGLDPGGYGSNLSLGLIESQYHDFGAAETHLRAAAGIDPTAPEPWYQLGMNSYEQDRLADAEQRLEEYLVLTKSKAPQPTQLRLALLTLDAIAGEEGKPADPVRAAEEETLRQKMGSQGSLAFSPDAARGAMSTPAPSSSPPLENPDQSAAIRATPRQVRELAANALNDWGTALARKQEYAAAVLPFRYAAAEDPGLDPVMRNLGFSAFMSRAWEESAQALSTWVASHADDVTARAYLGVAQFQTGEYSAAATTFEEVGPALASKPLMEASAAAAFARAGDRTRAAAALTGLEGSLSDPQAEARAAAASFDLGDLDHAITYAQSVLTQDAQNPEALRVLGAIDLENGHAPDAASFFERECEATPQDSAEFAEARALQARALIESGRRSEGEALALGLLRSHPQLAKKLRDEGEVLLKNGDPHLAREKFAAALALLPADAQLRRDFESAKKRMQAAAQ